MNSGLLVFQPQTFSADSSRSFPPPIQTTSKLQIRNFTFPWLSFFFLLNSRPPGLFRRLPPQRQHCLHPCSLQGPHIFFRHKAKPDRYCRPLLRTLPQLPGACRESRKSRAGRQPLQARAGSSRPRPLARAPRPLLSSGHTPSRAAQARSAGPRLGVSRFARCYFSRFDLGMGVG